MPMVHWPDSMFTFCPESCTLMPNDAFGQHLATSERFADEIDLKLAIEELAIYYANILTPVATAVGKAIDEDRRERLGLRRHRAVAWRHLAQRPDPDASSMPTTASSPRRPRTSSSSPTRRCGARPTCWRARSPTGPAEGVDVVLFDLAISPLAHITRHLMDARALLVGSPTLHHGMLYRVAGLLQYLRGHQAQEQDRRRVREFRLVERGDQADIGPA